MARRFEWFGREPEHMSLRSALLVLQLALLPIGCGGGSGPAGGGINADANAPAIVISTPSLPPAAAQIALNGTASDNVAVTEVAWSSNRGGSGLASGTANWSIPAIALADGLNEITVTARDAAGNVGTAAVSIPFNLGTSRVYYLSPTGDDGHAVNAAATPWKTFKKAFANMAAGDELVLLDGTYTAAETGYIHHDVTGAGGCVPHCAQIPSGGPSRSTLVHALNPGRVTIDGPLFIGRSTRKDSYIKVQGITFEGGGSVYNGDYVTIKDCGFHGHFAVGTNDHHMVSDHNLIEDVWIWASGQRVIAINYRSHFNVWRRVLVRGDGCGTSACSGSGNPNVGITVYDSSDISLQNVMVVDRVLAPTDSPYGDFAIAQHTPDARYYFGRNEWLGTLAIKSPDAGYYFEPDAGASVDPTVRIVNAVAWDTANSGFNLARAGSNNLLENATVKSLGGNGIRVAPELTTGTVRNAIVAGAGSWGINSKYPPSYVNVFGAVGGSYNQTVCALGCFGFDPLAGGAPALKHLLRVEAGSALKGAGSGGADIGANVVFRYGADGTRHGDAGYNALSTVPLWPWPNEERIKAEMCASTSRGFCAAGKRLDGLQPVTLTSYLWEYLGHPLPAGIYP